MHGILPAFLINRLDIFRSMNLLLWKKISILHACIVLSATRYNGIGQGICKNSVLWAVPNPCILVPVESRHCAAVLGLFGITWWSLFTFLVEKMSAFRSCLLLEGYYQLLLQVEVNWILKPIMRSGLTDEKEWGTGRVTKESLLLLSVLGLTLVNGSLPHSESL